MTEMSVDNRNLMRVCSKILDSTAPTTDGSWGRERFCSAVSFSVIYAFSVNDFFYSGYLGYWRV